jgi:hypothetical protein
MKKVLEQIKAFLKKLTPENIKNIAIATLVILIIIAGFRGCSLYKQSVIDKGKAEQAEKDKKANEKLSAELQKKNNEALSDNKIKDKKILEIDADREKLRKEKETSDKYFSNYKKNFILLSQMDKDKLLGEMLLGHGVICQVVAEGDYLRIIPKQRENLSLFVKDYEQLAIDKDNLQRDQNLCNEKNTQLIGKVSNLTTALADTTTQCTSDKKILTDDNDILKSDKKVLKKKLFWSRAAGVASTLLAILLLK